MADIVINEISQNYSYVIGDSSYCCVALPITASWGPAYTGMSSNADDADDSVLENTVWTRFKANSQGLEAFVSTYRGPAANYRLSQDYSYQMAVSLLTAGYDVLVCRLCPGSKADSMLHRSYTGKITAGWFNQIDQATGTLKLPIREDASATTELATTPFTVNSDHPVTVTSTNPSFKSTPITSTTSYVSLNSDTGTYALKDTADTATSHELVLEHAGTDVHKPDSGTSRIVFLDVTDIDALHSAIPDLGATSPDFTVTSAPTKVEYYDPTAQTEDARWKRLATGQDFNPVSGKLEIALTSESSIVPASYVDGAKLRVTFPVSYKAALEDAWHFVYHVKGSGASIASAWESAGITDNVELTYVGDKTATTIDGTGGKLIVKAKYPGTFGNCLQCTLRRMSTAGLDYWNFIVYVVDTSGVRLAVENLNFVFDISHSTDSILFIEEVESQFVDIIAENLSENSRFTGSASRPQSPNDKLTLVFSTGTDKDDTKTVEESLNSAMRLAATRFNTTLVESKSGSQSFVGTEAAPIQHSKSFEITQLPTGSIEISNVISCIYHEEGASRDKVLVADTDYTVDLATKTITISSDSTNVPAVGVPDSTLTVAFACPDFSSSVEYVDILCTNYNSAKNGTGNVLDATTASTWNYLEWLFTNSLDIYGLLNDRLAYNPNRVISPGWDDQNFLRLTGDDTWPTNITTPSPLHLKLMEAAYYSRCATAYIDLPKSIAKKYVSNDSQNTAIQGYAQLLARQEYPDTDGLFTTHSALFGPWGTYRYVGMPRQSTASPSFLALLIQRSMILNQSLQYEWIQPSSRKNRVNIGKMDYTVSKKYLDIWQPDPDTDGGVGVNAIANIPDLGLSIWGDSTLYENPPATYQALRNLSTRLLVNAIKNVVYKVGISITFQYTNQSAFSSFYVGVTPILDSMKNAGAIGDYKVVIGNDFDAVGMVKANSAVGKIYITPNGTIQHITVDLIALPPQTDLSNYS